MRVIVYGISPLNRADFPKGALFRESSQFDGPEPCDAYILATWRTDEILTIKAAMTAAGIKEYGDEGRQEEGQGQDVPEEEVTAEPAYPELTLHHAGGPWYEVRSQGAVVERFRGRAAAEAFIGGAHGHG